MWNRLLVALGLRPNYREPEYAPPSLGGSAPHAYRCMMGFQDIGCCVECGGGRLHSIHDLAVAPETPKPLPEKSEAEWNALLRNTPGRWYGE